MNSQTQTTEQLYRDLHHGLHAFVSRRVASRSDADDIVQDVFTRIHTKSAELEQVESVTGWIYRVTRNAIADYHRAHAASAGVAKKLSHESDTVDEAPESEAVERLARCVGPLLEQLGPEYREALSLTELGGLTQSEAAERVGISLSGMKSRVQRGRVKLAEAFRACCEIEQDVRQRIVGFEPCAPGDTRCGGGGAD